MTHLVLIAGGMPMPAMRDTTQCARCSAKCGDKVNFCDHCEEVVADAVCRGYCPGCNVMIEKWWNFCELCGVPLHQTVIDPLLDTVVTVN